MPKFVKQIWAISTKVSKQENYALYHRFISRLQYILKFYIFVSIDSITPADSKLFHPDWVFFKQRLTT